MPIAKVLNVLSYSFNALSLLIFKVSHIFLSNMFGINTMILGSIQSNCFFAASYFLFWLNVGVQIDMFFDSPIYLPLHRQYNKYTSGGLFRSSIVCFDMKWFAILVKCHLYIYIYTRHSNLESRTRSSTSFISRSKLTFLSTNPKTREDSNGNFKIG